MSSAMPSMSNPEACKTKATIIQRPFSTKDSAYAEYQSDSVIWKMSGSPIRRVWWKEIKDN